MKTESHTRNFPFLESQTNEKALARFTAHIDEARELLALVNEHLEDHLGADTESVHWGHVGDAERLKQTLQEIAETFQLTTNSV